MWPSGSLRFEILSRAMIKTAARLCTLGILFSSFALYAADSDVRLNSLGFLPDKDKRATINGECTTFMVCRVPAGTVAFSGTVTGPFADSQTGENQLRIADFSRLTETGTFYLDVPSVGKSSNFVIRPDAYNSAFIPVFKAMYLWRCGTGVSATYGGNTFAHAACHMQDAWLDQVGGGHNQIKATGGWHDAGDYNKYTVNAGITVGMMFMAWQQFQENIKSITYGLPKTAPGYPEFLEELKWETDWLLSMQSPDGQVYDKVSEISFSAFVLPESNTVERYFAPAGTTETAAFAAMMAMAARNFRPYNAAYAATCLKAAKAAYDYLASHDANKTADLTAFKTGNYARSNANAGRLWAAAEMWETTGDPSCLADFETRAGVYSPDYTDIDFDWANVKNLGMFTYVTSGRTGKNAALLDAIRKNIVAGANNIVKTRNANPYGRPLGSRYYWGCNGSVARQAMLLQIADRISANADYLNTALDAIGYLFGRNMHNRSYVTGVGINPPMKPHDRRSGADGIADPWPGYLVGGSPGMGSDPYLKAHTAAGLPAATYWADEQESYSSNEIAINWQGALIYAMAGFLGRAPAR